MSERVNRVDQTGNEAGFEGDVTGSPCGPPVMNHGSSSEYSPDEDGHAKHSHVENVEFGQQAFFDGGAPASSFDIFQLLEPARHGIDTNTRFSSSEEANAAMMSMTMPNWNDPTVPTCIGQKKAIVKAMCELMAGVDRAMDNPATIKPFAEGVYSASKIEAICWNVLDATITRQVYGSLPTVRGTKSKSSLTSEMESFADRITAVMEALATRKAICKHLMDPIYLYRFVNDPSGAQKVVATNKVLNKRKGDILSAGKAALEGTNTSSGSGTSVSSTQVADSPSPPKRVRRR